MRADALANLNPEALFHKERFNDSSSSSSGNETSDMHTDESMYDYEEQ